MLNNYINNKYLNSNKTDEIRNQYTRAKPFPHIELSDFFINDKIK